MKHYKPRILVSRCLEHEACRYDGSMISDAFVKRIKDHVEIITRCPEVDIGMPIPREAIRIQYKDNQMDLIASMSGASYTDSMVTYTKDTIETLKALNIHGAILKSRSPSCGIKAVKVYGGPGKRPSLDMKTEGFFGGGLMEGMPGLPVEDEGRLLNYVIRDHFLTCIYTLSYFEQVKKSREMSQLVAFQSDYKYLLMAYHPSSQKKLGQIVANHEKKSFDDVIEVYEKELKEALTHPLDPGKNTNVISHIFGYFSKDLSKAERDYFLEEIELYRNRKLPFPALMALLYGWVVRFKEVNLLNQKIFEPYPKHILDLADSGRGIK
jgi:uncharacterized protein YbgA (DUF1722 family)/uncharacterized protein YbbK (DUF523 family)